GVGLALIAGVGLWAFFSSRAQSKEIADQANRLFERVSKEDSAAFVELSNSSYPVRREFLRHALADATSADVLLRNRHSLAVALSRIDSGDTGRLYSDVIRERLTHITSPELAEAAMVAVTKWDLIDFISPADANGASTAVAAQIEQDSKN